MTEMPDLKTQLRDARRNAARKYANWQRGPNQQANLKDLEDFNNIMLEINSLKVRIERLRGQHAG